MDLVIIYIIALCLCLINSAEDEPVEADVKREVKLNPAFYKDEHAFMEVANGLGFGNNHLSTNSSDGSVWGQSVHAVSSDTSNNVRNEVDGNSSETERPHNFGANWTSYVGGVERSTR